MKLKQYDPRALEAPRPINIYRPDATAAARKVAAQNSSTRTESLIDEHIRLAREIASHLNVSQADAREAFFKEDHIKSLEDQKWPRWTSVWRLSLLQMNRLVQQAEGRKQRLRREAYNRELLRRLSSYDWWYDAIAPDQNGDRRRWHVHMSVLFYWDTPEQLVRVLQQYIDTSKPDLGLSGHLFLLAPASKEVRAKRDAAKHAAYFAAQKRKADAKEAERRADDLRRITDKKQELDNFERLEKAQLNPEDDFMDWDLFDQFYPHEIPLHLYRASKAKASGEPYDATPIYKKGKAPTPAQPVKEDGIATNEATDTLAASSDIDELEGMLDPFAAFDLQSLKGDDND